MTRKEARLNICEMIGAVKGRNGWTDTQLARRLGCSRRTITNMRDDPGRTRSETLRVLTELYEKGVTV
jgi:transcriptional regulator with XRE-family HTH domain